MKGEYRLRGGETRHWQNGQITIAVNLSLVCNTEHTRTLLATSNRDSILKPSAPPHRAHEKGLSSTDRDVLPSVDMRIPDLDRWGSRAVLPQADSLLFIRGHPRIKPLMTCEQPTRFKSFIQQYNPLYPGLH